MKKTLLTFSLTVLSGITGLTQTTFGPEQNIDLNTGNNPYSIVSGDLDGDTFIDIVIGTYDYLVPLTGDDINWYKNDGTGNFTLQAVVAASFDFVGGLHIADLDDINGNDIIATSQSGDKVSWFANNGAGGFGTETLIGNLDGPGQAVAIDINNDTNIDIVVLAYDGDKVVWYEGDGTGNFGTEQIIESGTDGPGAIDLADFDGDTDLDIVIGYTNAGTIEVYYNQFIESGTMTVSWVKDTNQVNSLNGYLFAIAFADINDDGNLDIIKSDNSPGAGFDVAWYNKEMDGTYTESSIPNSINRPGMVMVTDLNNDTFSDIVISNGETNNDDIIWFESTGAGTYYPEAMISNAQNQVFGFTINDFNGDTKPDIASIDFQNFDLNWFENDPPPLSLNDKLFNTINIYPNPTKNQLNFKGLSENIDVSVYDIVGKNVLNKNLDANESLDVSKLQSGIYILKFKDYDSTFKFVKE